jgi:hypothetical protein
MNKLSLEVSFGGKTFENLGNTYRNEGLSVGSNHMVDIRKS